MRYLLFLVILVVACKPLNEVEVIQKDHFIKFFGGQGNYSSVKLIEHEGGYLITGNTSLDKVSNIFVKQLDRSGNTVWEKTIDNAFANDMAIGTEALYFVGDSINIIDDTETVSTQYVIKTDANGNVLSQKTIPHVGPNINENDAHGNAVLVEGSTLLVLGEEESDNDTQDAVLSSINSSDLSIVWSKVDALDNRNSENSNNLYKNNFNNYLWVTSLVKEGEEKFQSYMAIPSREALGEPVSHDIFPQIETDTENYNSADIQKTFSGYAIVGTKTNVDNENGQIIYIESDINGIFIDESLMELEPFSNEDRGLGVQQTSDGGVLILGTITTNTTIGNGGTDFIVIKLDKDKNVLWSNNYGGSGNEISGKITELSDGSYIIFGTSELQGVASAVLIKMDDLGNLNN